MFSAQAVEKLKAIAEGIFSKAPAGTEHLTQAATTITSVTDADGPVVGGKTVTIEGSGFVAPVSVAFGGVPATDVVVVSDKKVTVRTPPHAAGIVDVTVTVDGKPPVKLSNGFAYKLAQGVPPAGTERPIQAATTITSVTDADGPVAGGKTVTIEGSGFVAPVSVAFGGVPATDVVVVSDKKVTVKTPPHAAGIVDVTATIDGKPPVGLLGGFTYK
jgi:glutamate dehydrogenase/leucine dehydrogenase